jgi:excisionase family DNA binding protein
MVSDELMENLWDISRAAKYVGIATGTMYNWVSADPPRIPCVRVGRSVRFEPDILHKWVTRKRQYEGV